MSVQPVVFDDKSFLRYLAFVEKGKQKEVLAETLTWIANSARRALIDDSTKKWTVRSTFVLRGYQTIKARPKRLESYVGHAPCRLLQNPCLLMLLHL